MEWLKKLWDFFGNLFSPRTTNAIMKGIRAAAPYVSYAIEICAVANDLAPRTKTVETVVRFADAMGVTFEGAVTEQKVGTALRDIAVKALKAKFPEASTSTLNRAVEIAVGALKLL